MVAMEKRKKKITLNPYMLVILSFILVIFIGAFILCMPFCQKSGKWGNVIDEVFVATSATCVTGLCAYKEGIAGQLTFAGHLVMIILIQIGGLGFITVLTFIVTLFKSKLQFKNRFFLSQMVGSTNFADVVKFVRRLILISFSVEGIGFLLGLPVFFHVYPNDPGKALWGAAFLSISAFNNAGFDLFGSTSVIPNSNEFIIAIGNGWAYYYLLSLIMFLIVAGGISFLVIIDIFSFKKPSQWRVFTKIVLSTTAVLLVSGTLLLFFSDGLKEDGMTLFQCLFQSVTCRTAGYATYNQDNISIAGKVISCILMVIGGSPLSTAGGIKTTTIFMIVLAMFCYFRGRPVVAFKREYSSKMILKAMALMVIAGLTILIGFLVMSAFETNLDTAALGLSTDKSAAIVYELFSAFGTVGVTVGITPYLTIGSKITLCVLMFMGRLGPMTFLSLFQTNMNKEGTQHYQYVEEDFLIG